jgi:hypothetical protein
MNIIKFIPYGKDNAISRNCLSELCNLPDRVMRLQIERARREYPILNLDGSGYFRPLPEEKPLVERWLRQERSRSRSIGNSALGAEKWLTGGSEGKSVTVRGYVRSKHKNAEPARQLDGQMGW